MAAVEVQAASPTELARSDSSKSEPGFARESSLKQPTVTRNASLGPGRMNALGERRLTLKRRMSSRGPDQELSTKDMVSQLPAEVVPEEGEQPDQVGRIDPSTMYNALCNGGWHSTRPYLLIDTRTAVEYHALSIPTSVSLPPVPEEQWPSTMEEVCALVPHQRQRQDVVARAERRAILFTAGKADSRWLKHLCGLLVQEKAVAVTEVLDGGFGKFLQLFPWVLTNSDTFGYPNEIVPHKLYLGNLEHALDKSVIMGMGVTHIVNASHRQDTGYVHLQGAIGVTVMNVPVEDDPDADLSVYFDKGAEFIQQAFDAPLKNPPRPNRVLVHCNAGMSRSPSLVMVYLMKHEGMSFKQAYNHCQRCRHIVAPNMGFRKQLLEYEVKLKGSASVEDDQLLDLGYDGGYLSRQLYGEKPDAPPPAAPPAGAPVQRGNPSFRASTGSVPQQQGGGFSTVGRFNISGRFARSARYATSVRGSNPARKLRQSSRGGSQEDGDSKCAIS